MARVWERFEGGPVKRNADRLHVTLNKGGVFTYNRKAFEELGKPQAAVFFFEKGSNTIGVCPAHPKLAEAFPFLVRNRGVNWQLNGIPFCRHFGIKPSGTEVFLLPEIDEKGILLLDLRRTQVVFGGKKR